MVILERLKNVLDKENECPENCACEKCRRDDEFVVRENLTDEEIEKIINSEYSDKKDDRLERIYLRRALKSLEIGILITVLNLIQKIEKVLEVLKR